MVWLTVCIQDPFPIDHILHRFGKGRFTVWQACINTLIGVEQISFRIVTLCAFCSSLFLKPFYHFRHIFPDRDLQEGDLCFGDLPAQIRDIFAFFFVPDMIQAVVVT